MDGDILLLIYDKTFIEVAERNMKGVVPLYYRTEKAGNTPISSETLYDGLINVFTHSNIGIYSNHVSKIWNDEVFVSGEKDEQQEAINHIKRLTAQNNWYIDGAKTLWVPEFPDNLKKEIHEYTRKKLPHFFVYAKDKDKTQVVEPVELLVDKLEKVIVKPRISYTKLHLKEPDYTWLMRSAFTECKVSFLPDGNLDEENTEPLIVKYVELGKKWFYKVDFDGRIEDTRRTIMTNAQAKQDFVLGTAIKETRDELAKIIDEEWIIVDKLVKFLYGISPNKHKHLFWCCYGKKLYYNLKNHYVPTSKFVKCSYCGKQMRVGRKELGPYECKECVKKGRRATQNYLSRLNSIMRK